MIARGAFAPVFPKGAGAALNPIGDRRTIFLKHHGERKIVASIFCERAKDILQAEDTDVEMIILLFDAFYKASNDRSLILLRERASETLVNRATLSGLTAVGINAVSLIKSRVVIVAYLGRNRRVFMRVLPF